MLSKLKWFNLALRGIMELGIVIAFLYWGIEMGNSKGTKIAFGLGAPLIGFGFWGAVDFHETGHMAEYLRLIEELVISGLAAAAFYIAGQHALGVILGLISVSYHALVYLTGERLLKH